MTCDLPFDAAMRALGLSGPDAPDVAAWRDGWDDSQAAYPPGGPEFLRPAFLAEQCRALALSDELSRAIVAAVADFADDGPLRQLAWHCHFTLFGRAGGNARDAGEPDIDRLGRVVPNWPADPRRLPDWGEVFYAVVLLSGTPWVMDYHRRRGVGMDVTIATAGDLELWMRHYRDRTGRWGLDRFQWIVHHFLGRLYRLGRLQFRMEEYSWGFHVYRHARDGRVTVLADEGMRFGPGGLFALPADRDAAGDEPGTWTATFHDDGCTIRGCRIDPTGRALPGPVELPAAEWAPALAKGEPMLGIHIPAGEPMAFDACGESFRRAAGFFARHFADRPFRAFQCGSWLLDSQLASLLPPESNIRRFQRQVYLLPLPYVGDQEVLDRVFGRRYDNLADAPRDTLLRRAVLDHLAAGGHFRPGGCLLFAADLDWGPEVYLRRE